jgi:hypothetical protein
VDYTKKQLMEIGKPVRVCSYSNKLPLYRTCKSLSRSIKEYLWKFQNELTCYYKQGVTPATVYYDEDNRSPVALIKWGFNHWW